MKFLMIIFIFYVLVFALDFLPHFKGNKKGDNWFYLISFSVTLAVNLLYGLGVEIPSPAKPIQNIVEAVFQLK